MPELETLRAVTAARLAPGDVLRRVDELGVLDVVGLSGAAGTYQATTPSTRPSRTRSGRAAPRRRAARRGRSRTVCGRAGVRLELLEQQHLERSWIGHPSAAGTRPCRSSRRCARRCLSRPSRRHAHRHLVISSIISTVMSTPAQFPTPRGGWPSTRRGSRHAGHPSRRARSSRARAWARPGAPR